MADIIVGPSDAIIYFAEAETIIKKGQAIFTMANGHIALAKADSINTAKVIGLASEDIDLTAIGPYIKIGSIEMDNWNDVIGASELVPGSSYYLDVSVAGRLTSTAPTTAGQVVCPIGQAISTTTLILDITSNILL